MKKTYFPLFTDISQKRILVVGGGRVAWRRVKTLLPFGATITVIAPKIIDHLMELEKAGEISLICREYKSTDIKDADLVLATTDNPQLNRTIFNGCKEELQRGRTILVNVADDRALCDFYFPSVIYKDDFVVGISSGGKAPGKVKELRKKLEAELGEEI